ncbi:MAG: thioredoxin family protein [Gammaproteobacteria bacterium]|nr:thioredoxin family protein [Gammaproteobacteria bacterium]
MHKIRNGLFLMVFLLWSSLQAPVAVSADGPAVVSTAHAVVTLLSEQPQATPGQTLWLGLRFELIPHWHVYWRNPGASGAAPVIRWTLPDGWEAGEIHWPAPRRIRVDPLTNYGYEGVVMFLAPIRIPDGPLPTGPLSVTADAEWLVCREECVPEAGRFTLALDHDDHPAASVRTRELFATARRQWPEATILTGHYRLDGDALAISVETPSLTVAHATDVWFAADQWGPVDASGAQHWARMPTGFTLRAPLGDAPPVGDTLEGLLVIESLDNGASARRSYPVQLVAGLPAIGNETLGWMAALGFAFLGGLILNVMPCVLPVLGIKLLGFVQEAGADRRRLAGHGLIYGFGILVSFGMLAAGLLMLRAGGEALGWGFQLQSPVLIALLAYLMLLVGLNLSGVFSVGDGLMGVGQSLTAGHGFFKTFATGVLAAVVASPCTAPFMGTALGFAITRPAGEALTVFLALGAGFALPVLLLSLWPAWVRLIPKPGPWMQHFQQILAFPLYATAAWLLWVLSQQTGPSSYGAALAGLVATALVAWLYGQWHPRGWWLALLGAGLTVALTLTLGPLVAPDTPANSRADQDQRRWSDQQVQRHTAAGHPVFVNFTAAWCITCKVNERLALATENTQRLFASRSVVYLVADWTRRDPAITRQLERYGRSGVPLYLLYSPTAGQPVVLPQLLTEDLVAEAIHAL